MRNSLFVGEPTDGLATPQAAAVNKQPECLKTCGSKGCKKAIKSDTCDGMKVAKACIATAEKLPGDKEAAGAWLSGKGDRIWLNQHGERSHARRYINSAPQPAVATV